MINNKLFFKLLVFSVFAIVVISGCTKDEDDYIPPHQPIITENPDSCLGDVTVTFQYYHNGHYSAAPSGTKVRLFQNYDDLVNDIPLYRFEVAGTNYIIYFGYLNPGDYYVLAYARIGMSDYEGVNSIMIVQNQHVEVLVTMEKIITE
ncbi:MAG: hypothetical protein KAT68_10300 [Bacteroidales bacterium]|nr:hypothetical protein [Bacteroidales bacterium]